MCSIKCFSSSGNLSNEEIVRKRNRIFDFEQKKQRDNIGRVEKIEVKYIGTPNDATMVMNKNLSTPYNCAQRKEPADKVYLRFSYLCLLLPVLDISETKCKTSVVALVDNKILWDMHRPLKDSCSLELLTFRGYDPFLVNKAFWRSCSFLLGAAMQRTFKESAGLFLHSFPPPIVRSGSFVHDIALNDGDWQPTASDFHTLGLEMVKIASEATKFERLEVSHDIALEIFRENPFKREQLPSISNTNEGVVTIYRVGEHIDISKGPMIASSSFLNKCKIAAAHKISIADDSCNLYRVQGVALPASITMSSFAFNVIVERAKKLVS